MCDITAKNDRKKKKEWNQELRSFGYSDPKWQCIFAVQKQNTFRYSSATGQWIQSKNNYTNIRRCRPWQRGDQCNVQFWCKECPEKWYTQNAFLIKLKTSLIILRWKHAHSIIIETYQLKVLQTIIWNQTFPWK